MTVKTIGYLALTVALIAATAGYFNGLGKDKIAAAEQRNIELKAKVDALSKTAKEHKALADEAGQKVENQDKAISTLKAKLAKAQSDNPHPLGAATPMGGTSAAGAQVDGSVDSLKDQIIDAQDRQISTLKIEVSELRAALDLKDRALVTAEQRARGLELALEAQRHASKSQRWLGRIEGVAVGIAIGYVGGKLQ